MRIVKRFLMLLLMISLVIGSLCSTGLASDKLTEDPTVQGWSVVDLFVVRPLGVAAGIGGTVIFVASLPFTVPSGSVGNAAKMFIAQPFQFSFLREVPDPEL